MSEKYYEAYDLRYRQVHAQNLQWFADTPSAIVGETIGQHGIGKEHSILEIGCGEGRDAMALINRGFQVTATDISSEAIAYCRQKMPDAAQSFQVLDCINGQIAECFDFIYAIAVLHMLVLDADRDAFYHFIRTHLKENGVALIGTMGDGTFERQSDISNAFETQSRMHESSGKTVEIASTSCRVVTFASFEQELQRNGLKIVQSGLTCVEPDFPQMMYAVLKKA